MALVDYFLKIDGISGESTDDKHKGEIEVASFSWGVRQTTARATGGAGAGKATFQDFQFTKVSDKASPALFQKCATGEHIKQAVLTARKAGETQQEFLKVTLSDLLVSSYQSGGTATPSFIEITTPNDVAFLSQNLTTDNAVNADDLTLASKRIGQLSVDPTNPNLASLDIDMLPILSKHDTDSFGIRLQLHGAGIPEPLETAEDRDEESGETAPSRDVTAFFSMTLNFDTA